MNAVDFANFALLAGDFAGDGGGGGDGSSANGTPMGAATPWSLGTVTM